MMALRNTVGFSPTGNEDPSEWSALLRRVRQRSAQVRGELPGSVSSPSPVLGGGGVAAGKPGIGGNAVTGGLTPAGGGGAPGNLDNAPSGAGAWASRFADPQLTALVNDPALYAGAYTQADGGGMFMQNNLMDWANPNAIALLSGMYGGGTREAPPSPGEMSNAMSQVYDNAMGGKVYLDPSELIRNLISHGSGLTSLASLGGNAVGGGKQGAASGAAGGGGGKLAGGINAAASGGGIQGDMTPIQMALFAGTPQEQVRNTMGLIQSALQGVVPDAFMGGYMENMARVAQSYLLSMMDKNNAQSNLSFVEYLGQSMGAV